MSYVTKASFIVLFGLFGCTDKGDPISSSSNRGTFVLDLLTLTGAVKTDTITGSPAVFITLRAAYHFDGQAGTLDGISISTPSYTIGMNFEPANPQAIGSRQLIDLTGMRISSSFNGEYLIPVHVQFAGRFWERSGTSVTHCASFATEYTQLVHVQR